MEELISAIVTLVSESGGYITKTKLLKLLYLFDVEFYRVYRRTYTGFGWKFFHLGPWAPEYDDSLETAIVRDLIKRRISSSEYEVELLYPSQKIELDTILTNVKDEYILRGVLNLWGPCSTGEILDYVYFQTPPMEAGIRNQPLDFSTIPEDKPTSYSRISSEEPKTKLIKLRAAFKKKKEERKATSVSDFEFTPPKYDDEFIEAMEKLETI